MLESSTRSMFTPDGREIPIYLRLYTLADPVAVEDLLTNPRWAWFNPGRDDPRYLSALNWLKAFMQSSAAQN